MHSLLSNNTLTEIEGKEDRLSYKTVIAILILIFHTIATPIFHKINFYYIHESGICMILGFIIALISKFGLNTGQKLNTFIIFDDEFFFNIVLPPIIFSAGYNLKKKSFFNYFSYIITFGIFGTLISFGTIAILINYSNNYNLFGEFKLDLKTLLLFSSVIASTDTVVSLSFINDNEQPKLFSILFGVGVLNDEVCIALYRIIKNFDFNQQLSLFSIFTITNSFLILFAMSTLLGIGGGLLCSLTLKLLKPFHLNRVQESSLIVFFAFLTYSITDTMDYSSIIALLFCGIFMSHYAFYNLSFQAREESSIVSKIMSNISEGFVFTYLGLTSISIPYESFSFKFILLVFIFVLIGRFFSIYGLSFLLKLLKCNFFQFSKNEQGITFFAGCIRGAVAFGLAISIPSNSIEESKNKKMLISSTLILVFLTTIIFGALMNYIIKYFSKGKKKNDNIDPFNEALQKYSLQGYDGELMTIESGKIVKNTEEDNYNNSGQIKGFWYNIDDNILRPIFIDDWPDVKYEHEEIAKEILQILKKHEESKMKDKILRRFNANNPSSFEALNPKSKHPYSKNDKENNN